MKANLDQKSLKGSISLRISPGDPVAWKLLMLFDAASHTHDKIEVIAKNYGYTHEHFIDPHRVLTSSKQVMAKKRKDPKASSLKMLQTIFSISAKTGQPIMAGMSSSGMPISMTITDLINTTGKIMKSKKS